MVITDIHKTTLEDIQSKVKILSQLEKVHKDLFILLKQKEKLEKKLSPSSDDLNEKISDKDKTDASDKSKVVMDSKGHQKQ